MRAQRASAAFLALLVMATGGCSLFRKGETTVTFHEEGAAPTTVTVPGDAGEPKIAVLPAPATATLPPGTRPLARPVHVEAPKDFSGTATVKMAYDPTAVTDPADLAIYTYIDDLGTWLPAGDVVDTTQHTVSATTKHFSDWMLAVTDPDQLRYDQTIIERLKKTTGGRVASLMYGEPRSLSCRADRVLVPAAVKSDLIPGPAKLCQQVVDDGTYELEWINNTELPVVFDLPDGFRQITHDYRLNPMLQGVLQHHRHPKGAIVLPDRSLKVAFGAEVVESSTRINGELDWSIYLIALLRQLVEFAMLDESADNPKAREKIDLAFESAGWADCVGKGINDWNENHRVDQMVRAAVGDCKDKIAKLALDWFVKTGKEALGSLKKFFSKRFDVLLGLDKLMTFARSEISGLLALPGALTGALDTTVTVEPGRVMTYDEARRMPKAQPFGDAPPCTPLASGAWPPAGMPASGLCLQAIELDLDGNERPDRLITWRPESKGPGVDLIRPRIGAVAYLDDGTFHLLQIPVRQWRDVDVIDLFDLGAVIHLGSDTRAQALIVVTRGSSALHHVVLALDSNKRLRPVTADGRLAGVTSGRAAAYGSTWGCALSRGKPVFVQSYWSNDLAKPNAPRQWWRVFTTFTGTQLTEIGGDDGTIGAAKLPVTGSNCAKAPIASRGPEIGAVQAR